MTKKGFKETLDKLWKDHKKDLDKALKNAGKMLKDGEVYIKDKSEQGKRQLEVMSLSLQREKLYYELGKAVSKFSQSKLFKSKKPQKMLAEIKHISGKIKKIASKK